jgi:predicted NBD/HSP70 family sugar kinase
MEELIGGDQSVQQCLQPVLDPDVVPRATRESGVVDAGDFDVVVGGGLGLRDDYRQAAASEMRVGIEAHSSRHVPVVPAELGADAGAVGAALLAAERARGA